MFYHLDHMLSSTFALKFEFRQQNLLALFKKFFECYQRYYMRVKSLECPL
jgi:hypothetical protein